MEYPGDFMINGTRQPRNVEVNRMPLKAAVMAFEP